MKSKLDVQQTEDQRRRVFYAVRTMWPKLPEFRWLEMTERILQNRGPVNFDKNGKVKKRGNSKTKSKV